MSITSGGLGAVALLGVTRELDDRTRWLVISAVFGVGLVLIIIGVIRQTRRDSKQADETD